MAKQKAPTQNPKLKHLEKVIETLSGKLSYKLEEQARLAANPMRAQEEAQTLATNLMVAYKEAFGHGAEVYTPVDDLPENPTGWLITPVASERNLIRASGPISSVFAYVEEGIVSFAAIWQPVARKFAHATHGLGAVIADEGRLRMSKIEELTDQTIVSLPWQSGDAEAVLKTAVAGGFHTRKTGCPADDIMNVTSGRCDVMVGARLTPAVTAALSLFVSEAGGALSENDGVLVVSNLDVHAAAKQFLA